MSNCLETDVRHGLARYWTADPAEALRLIEAVSRLGLPEDVIRVERSSRNGGGWWVLVSGLTEIRLVALADLLRDHEWPEITAAMIDQEEAAIERQQAVAFDSWLEAELP